MKVNLHNRSRRALVLNLPYQLCGELSFCHRQMRGKVVQMSDGSKQVAPQKARLSTSLTLLVGESAYGLPGGALKAPEVQSALKRRALKSECMSDSEYKDFADKKKADEKAAAERRKTNQAAKQAAREAKAKADLEAAEAEVAAANAETEAKRAAAAKAKAKADREAKKGNKS